MLKKLIQPIKIHNIKIHLSAIILIVVGLWFGFFNRLAVAYIITAIHELAHITAARRLGVNVKDVEILPFGLTMRLGEEGIRHPADEVRIAMAGPVSNFVIAYLVYGVYTGGLRDYIIGTSLVIGVFNLLPVLPLDGGRGLRAVLVRRYGCIKGFATAMRITKWVTLVIVVAGMWVLYITKFNFSLLLVGAFLIANITEERKNTNMVIMKDILYSRNKLEEGGAENGEVLVVKDTERATKVLPRLTYDKYYLIKIVDSSMRVRYTLTETSFIEGLAIMGVNTPMRKFVGL